MTPEQMQLIRQSWDALSPVWSKVAGNVYNRFFELAPDARPLFSADLEPLKIKLMDTITVIVGYLDNPDMFQSIINHSGRQHQRFGARSEHFSAFRNALMEGLDQQFGRDFTPQLREAWTVLYDEVQREMLRGMAV